MLDELKSYFQALSLDPNFVKVPHANDTVYNRECAYSFDTPESPRGIYTNLSSWQSFGKDYLHIDSKRSGQLVYLHQKWRKVLKEPEQIDDAENLPTKFALGVENGFNPEKRNYDIKKTHQLYIVQKDQYVPFPFDEIPNSLFMCCNEIINRQDVRVDEEVATWEEEIPTSIYAENLVQIDSGRKISSDPKQWKCDDSGVTENLWLNLSDGHIGSGRANWDGTGGNGSALIHYENTGRIYPLVVKLGTITAKGADVYSYAEDCMVHDPYLKDHLRHWGINMDTSSKTEKTMAELQIDLNLSFEYDKITEAGKDLVPLTGAGLIGLENLGNSCYMSSILQVVTSLPEVKGLYLDHSTDIFETCYENPYTDLITQFSKIVVALQTDRYKNPKISKSDSANNDSDILEYEPSVRPLSLKTVVGRGNAEFSSARQQDALEFFQYFIDKLHKAEISNQARLSKNNEGWAPLNYFEFLLEVRVECSESRMVRYLDRVDNVLSLNIPVDKATNSELVAEYKEREAKRQKVKEEDKDKDKDSNSETPVKYEVPFQACIEDYASTREVSDFFSSAVKKRTMAYQTERFKTFPRYLVVHLRRYYVSEDWSIKKLDASVQVPEVLNIDYLRGQGLKEGEQLLPEEEQAAASAALVITPDASIVAQLMGMGFSENGSKRAAIAINNSSVEAGVEWVFAHIDDPDFNDPLPEVTSPKKGASIDPDAVSMLKDMGFTDAQAIFSLETMNGSVEQAADWLFTHGGEVDSLIARSESQKKSSEAQETGGNGQKTMDDGAGLYNLVGFVSHMGGNTSSGHYVAHLKQDKRWVLFNDGKVAVSEEPPLNLGYMYFYRRADAKKV